MNYKFVVIAIILLGSIFLMGCNLEEEAKKRPKYKTSKYYSYFKICLQGVSYWWHPNRLAPVYKQDGSLELCEDNKI